MGNVEEMHQDGGEVFEEIHQDGDGGEAFEEGEQDLEHLNE